MQGASTTGDLENEIARLNRELAAAKERADALKAELQAFVYAASHDLKEPLRNITSYAQLLARTPPGDDAIHVYTQFITEGVRAATTLIEQLVSLSRAGSSTQRSMVNLASCVQTALYKLSSLVTDRKAKVSYRDLPEVSANALELEQVFERLIDNAIKYSGSGEPVVEISAEEGEEGHLISVHDNGPGIDPKFHKDVFQPFKRLHGRDIPGAGVGLAFCRRIIEAHEGRIWVESNGVNGSTFKILFPY